MSEPSVLPGADQQPRRPAGHRADRRRRGGCLKVVFVLLLFLALIAAAGWFVLKPRVEEFFADPEDYAGPGRGEVTVVIDPGQSIRSMGEELEELGVVASADAFVEAAEAEPESTSIQAGTYLMKREMSAADAVAVLVDPDNVAQEMVTVPEGMRVEDVVALLAKRTDFGAGQFEKVLARPERLGLPSYADGNPEGYLFPATYPVTPGDTPTTILRAMVDRWQVAADEVDLEGSAEALGYTPAELMTVASLVEAEARGDDMPKVARVIYNRLEQRDRETAGLLQLDATVNFAHDRDLGARTTSEDRQIDSPYNTYVVPGLPPGPIESPGQAAMEAAAAPADGDWFYYVTVNLDTGETKFAETLDEHNANVEELNEYCRTQSDRC